MGALPLYYVGETLVVATTDPLNQSMLDEVAARTDRVVTPVVCTEEDLEATLERLYRAQYLQRSTSELIVRTPDELASRVLSRSQVVGLSLAGVLLIVLLWRMPAVMASS